MIIEEIIFLNGAYSRKGNGLFCFSIICGHSHSVFGPSELRGTQSLFFRGSPCQRLHLLRI